MNRFKRIPSIVLLLLLGFVLGACVKQQQPTRWDSAQQQSAQNQPATVDESLPGSAFNTFFPSAEGEFDITYTQEKQGFAQAKLKKGGQEMALLSISDTRNNPEATEKFNNSAETLQGYPVVDVGSKGTAILVADRFQVQVRSSTDAFTQFDREDWLKQFDLDGLSQLE